MSAARFQATRCRDRKAVVTSRGPSVDAIDPPDAAELRPRDVPAHHQLAGVRRLVAVVLALAFVLVGTTGSWAAERYALVVGANYGIAGDEPLLYAERDASRVADVLTRLGDVPPQNLLVLKGTQSQSVLDALTALERRIAADVATGERPMLMLYYSGHADSQALHMHGTVLRFDDLKARIRAVGADVSVLVIDACRSGGLTRVKGATPAEPFEITPEDRLTSEGLAIITSSAEGEDAQESDRLKGGVFTHHFVNGLLGAADVSKDRRVTLSEAYNYAFNQTLRATTRTRFIQHPTYSFKMKGRQDVVLTRTVNDIGLGKLRLLMPGEYVVIEAFGGGEVAAEVHAEAGTEVLLAPGDYVVRRRGTSALHEANVKVSPGADIDVANADMERIPYRQTVRRGYTNSIRSALSFGVAFEMSGPIQSNTGVGLFGALQGQLDLADLALQARFRYGRTEGDNSTLSVVQTLYGLDLGIFKLFDFEDTDFAAGLGLRGGVEWLFQRFDTRGVAPTRDQAVGRIAPALRLEYAPTAAMALQLDCGADIYVMEVERESGRRVVETPVAPFCSFGFGAYLP